MPERFRDTLLCVTGLTPQVVTETVYALAQEAAAGGKSRIPERIEVITTTEGRRRIQLSLFSRAGGQGHFDQLCSDCGIDRDAITFDESCIHVIRNGEDEPLGDIVNADDNAHAADLINDRIRAWTTDDDVRLHVSLAGGRKTMGFYAGYALSLYARPQDRLSHVLVNPPFESHPDFFYPPPYPRTLTLRGRNDYVSTADARLQLADIPFVRLREEMDKTLLYGELSFSEAVARAQQVLERPELVIDVGERVAWLQGHPVELSATHFAWLTCFARRVLAGRPPIGFGEEAADDLRATVDWLEGEGPSTLKDHVEAARDELRQTGDSGYFSRTRTRLNTALSERSGLHPAAVARYQLRSYGRRPHTVYGLPLAAEQVRIEGEP
ncbi:hypothetical protein KBTX_02387 [wastewater metagenome]|uniref:CRISPR system ring nuclease SSO2081-like domain-containing protein n=2 Tax=unclassified sequences TaxID=12908 RepID=A0A5B8RDS9_9ZZZZ|nr:CRISPR-associated ring nuclease Csm6 [Arhodomonas sp. KWT]QEA06058.1 hypothetical protein KBTEX_02387 [uncultured organism]